MASLLRHAKSWLIQTLDTEACSIQRPISFF